VTDPVLSSDGVHPVPGPPEEGRWTDAFLDRYRQIMDPLADELVRDVLASGEISSVNDLLGYLIANDGIVPRDMPPKVRDYLQATDILPAWADPQKLVDGEEVFSAHGLDIVLALFCSSLPAAYAAAKGVEVLYLSAELRTNPVRRIIETAQMVIDVMAPGGLSATGDGRRDCQKVRLMHAGVRYWTLASGKWNASAWDQPINQEDLAGTLCTFTTAVFQALESLNAKLTRDQLEAYFHCWRVVAYLLGVQPILLPDNVDDAWALTNAIRRRQFRRSEAGQAMARALTQMMADSAPRLLKGLPPALMRHVLGDQIGNLLGLPPPGWSERLVNLVVSIVGGNSHLERRSWIFAWLTRYYQPHLIDALVAYKRGGQRPSFHIPDALRDRWHVRTS
jgi:uncharacterized protein (DUF2236 family)